MNLKRRARFVIGRKLQQGNELSHGEAGLTDDCTQRAAAEIAGMNRNRHLAGGIDRMNEAAVSPRCAGDNKARAPKSADNLVGSQRRKPFVHAASVTVTSRMRGGSPEGIGSPRAAQSASTRRIASSAIASASLSSLP